MIVNTLVHFFWVTLSLLSVLSIRKFAIWLAPWAGKMNQTARCDWLPERARWSHLASFFFCEFMDLDFFSVHKHAKKELGQYPASLTSHLVNSPYCIPYDSASFEFLAGYILPCKLRVLVPAMICYWKGFRYLHGKGLRSPKDKASTVQRQLYSVGQWQWTTANVER